MILELVPLLPSSYSMVCERSHWITKSRLVTNQYIFWVDQFQIINSILFSAFFFDLFLSSTLSKTSSDLSWVNLVPNERLFSIK